VPKRQENPGP